MRRRNWVPLLAALVAIGCSRPHQPAIQPASITLATTTSTRDSGLLDVLIPRFGEQTRIEVRVIAVGSGQALELGRRGDADVLLVHSPSAEEAFMKEGAGLERVPVMVNDFVLVGPADPDRPGDGASIVDGFREIARRRLPFVSRGDDSGTHQKEKSIWAASGIEPGGDWYLKAGAGMAQALRLASEKRAYVLSDRATFLTLRDEHDLIVASQYDPLLRNPYHVIIVNPARHPTVNQDGARRFVEFLTSAGTRTLIREFGLDRYGQSLFLPTESRP